MTWLTVTEYPCHRDDNDCVLFVEATIPSFFPPSYLITGLLTRVTRRNTHVKLELHTMPEHISSRPVFTINCILLKI
jgi:hypothetical protein